MCSEVEVVGKCPEARTPRLWALLQSALRSRASASSTLRVGPIGRSPPEYPLEPARGLSPRA